MNGFMLLGRILTIGPITHLDLVDFDTMWKYHDVLSQNQLEMRGVTHDFYKPC